MTAVMLASIVLRPEEGMHELLQLFKREILKETSSVNIDFQSKSPIFILKQSVCSHISFIKLNFDVCLD